MEYYYKLNENAVTKLFEDIDKIKERLLYLHNEFEKKYLLDCLQKGYTILANIYVEREEN